MGDVLMHDLDKRFKTDLVSGQYCLKRLQVQQVSLCLFCLP